MKVIKIIAQGIVLVGDAITLVVLSPWLIYMAADAYLEKENKQRDKEVGL